MTPAYDLARIVPWVAHTFNPEVWPSQPRRGLFGEWVIGYYTRFAFGERVTADTLPIGHERAIEYLYATLARGIQFISYPWISARISTARSQLNVNRAGVLLRLFVIVGPNGMDRFANLQEAVRACDWRMAAAAIWESNLYRQYPDIARPMAIQMDTGCDDPSLLYDTDLYAAMPGTKTEYAT